MTVTEYALPREVRKADKTAINKMFIFSQQKVGKTSNLMQLPNALLIDLENSSDFFDGMAINVQKRCAQTGKGPVTTLFEIADDIRKANADNGEPIYDYVILDTATAMEDMARHYATYLYKKTNMGQSFAGSDVVSELPKGAGYEWLRTAFLTIYKSFEGLAANTLIITGHVKNSSILKEGKDLGARDINLTGKLKLIVCADADAIGFLYRNKSTNENVLSFKTSEQDLVTGARPEHLSGQEFLISSMDDNKQVTTYWDKVFLNLNKTK